MEELLEEWKYTFRADLKYNEVYLACNEDWSYGIIGCEKENVDFHGLPCWAGILLFGFYTKICKKSILLIHASDIDDNGQGIVFIGPSNIGKTTQAELWHEYEGADILNGDKVFLQVDEKSMTAFGNPWKGSSPYYLNKCVPLTAAVVLRKSLENEMHELFGEEKLTKVMSHGFLPHWDLDALSVTLSTVDTWLSNGSVYQLSCMKDRGAVKLVQNALGIE